METTRIPDDQLEQRFDRFTKHFLLHDSTTVADIEIMSPEIGDQFETEGAHLLGVTYDPKDKAIEFELDGGEHRISHPKEVWTVEDADGFIKTIEIVRDDDTREIVKVNRRGISSST
jgi:hypothetical protein